MKKNKRQKVEEWLIRHEDFLTITALERKIGFSRGVLYKFLRGKRKLKTYEIKQIDRFVKDMIFNYLE